MRDALEVLKEKEAELHRVRHQVESLRIACSLLDDEPGQTGSENDDSQDERTEADAESQATGTDGLLFSSSAPSRPGFWNKLKREK